MKWYYKTTRFLFNEKKNHVRVCVQNNENIYLWNNIFPFSCIIVSYVNRRKRTKYAFNSFDFSGTHTSSDLLCAQVLMLYERKEEEKKQLEKKIIEYYDRTILKIKDLQMILIKVLRFIFLFITCFPSRLSLANVICLKGFCHSTMSKHAFFFLILFLFRVWDQTERKKEAT